jgi:hypothetical protein
MAEELGLERLQILSDLGFEGNRACSFAAGRVTLRLLFLGWFA